MKAPFLFSSLAFILLVVTNPAMTDGSPFIGSTATLATIEEGVSGTATIVDAQTIRVDNFYFNGGGISVYFRLGTNNTSAAFGSGLTLGDQLVGHIYNNATVVLNLPSGQTIDGYNAISVYCVDANVNFGSGAFIAPAQPHLDDIQQTNGITSVVLSGETGKPYELQGSTDLTNWTDLELETNTTGTITFTDTNQFDIRFYRAMVR